MMKNRSLWIFLILAFCLNAYGQQKEITEQEFLTARADASKKLTGYNRRLTYKSEAFSLTDGKPTRTINSIFETILPDKTRYFVIDLSGDTTKKLEIIRIGFIEYRRVDDGEWTKTDLSGIGSGSGSGTGIGSGNVKISFKYTVDDVALNGQQTKLYESYRTIEWSETTKFSDEKFWINKEGLILKRENKSGYLNPERIESQSVSIYEYNPKDLKIEAPM